MTYVRRLGDDRPFRRDPETPLCWRPATPVRWLPRHGEPWCVIELIAQTFVKALAWAPIYTALIATLTLVAVWVTR